MNYVPLDEVTALVKSVIGTASDMDEALFRQWAWQALQKLGVSEDEIKVCSIKVKSFLAPIPDDCRTILDISLYDANGCNIPHVYHSGTKRIYPKELYPTAVVNTNRTEPPMYIPVDVSSDRYNVVIGSDADFVSTVALRYFSYPIDANGFPLIREDEVNAVVYFCRWWWAMRKNDNRSEIAQNKEDWMLEADQVKAKKKMISNGMAKSIAKKWRSVFPFPKNNMF